MVGINNKERDYIKYNPSLTYSKKILSFVSEDTSYTPSDTIVNLLDKKPSGLLGDIQSELDINKMLQERLTKCLQDTNINGTTVAEYMQQAKRKDGDKELVRKFDKDNALAINGTSQAECLPLLLEMEEELLFLQERINQHFYNNEINLDHLEYAEEKDELKMNTLIDKDKQGTFTRLDRDNLAIDNLLLEVVYRRTNNCKNMSKQMNELLCTTVNTYYNGNVEDIVHKYGEADVKTLEHINEVNKISFRQTTALSEEDKLRNKKLNAPTIKADIQDMFSRICELKQRSNAILDFALSIDTDYDQNAYTQIVSDAFDQVEFINESFDQAALELFKQIKLDEIVKNDIVDTMKAKREARQKIALISDIIKEKQSGTFNATEFVNSRGLRHQGTLCSK